MALKERENWREEKKGAFLYRVMAKREKDPVKQELFANLALAAEEQAAIWEKTPPPFVPDFRTRLVAFAIHFLGAKPLKGILAAMKVRGLSVYLNPSPPHLLGHDMPATLNDVGASHHRSSHAGNLRAAVFGINDGLVSNTSLIMGFAGAAADPQMIFLAGIAGGLAGAFSMAAGEYISVKSQREMFEYQIGLERDELAQYPREEAAELALIYQARGLKPDEAKTLADKMIADPKRGLDTLAREELGLNPEDLASPMAAALFSFSSFALGSIVPLIPFLAKFLKPVPWAIGLSVLSLFGVGALMSLFTGRNAPLSGLRMVAIGAGAAALTFWIGGLVGR